MAAATDLLRPHHQKGKNNLKHVHGTIVVLLVLGVPRTQFLVPQLLSMHHQCRFYHLSQQNVDMAATFSARRFPTAFTADAAAHAHAVIFWIISVTFIAGGGGGGCRDGSSGPDRTRHPVGWM